MNCRRAVFRHLVVKCAILIVMSTVVLGQAAAGDNATSDAPDAGEEWIRARPVFAEYTDKAAVYLSWTPKAWKPGLVGFTLSRRHIDEMGKWTGWARIGPYPITPDLTEKRLQTLQLDKVLGRMEEWDKLGNPRKPEDIIAKLEADAKEAKQVLMMASMNRQWNMAFGFAWLDTEAPRGKVCEYRLAPLMKDQLGRVAQGDVLGTIQIKASYGAMPCPPLINVKAVRVRSDRVNIEFQAKKEDIDAYRGAEWFALLKARPSEPMSTIVYKTLMMCDVSADGEHYKYSMWDSEPGKEAVKYAIAPITDSGIVGQLSDRIIVSRMKEPVQTPTEVTAEITDEGVVVSWKYKAQADSIAGFQVTRIVDSEGSGKSDILPPGARSWTDKTILAEHPGSRITYRVTAVSGDFRSDVVVNAEPVMGLRIPYPIPPTPEGFASQVIQEGDDIIIECRWKPVESMGMAGYRVEEYQERLGSWFSLGGIKETRWRKSVGRHGGSIKLRVVAITMDGQRSEPSELLVRYPPTTRFPIRQLTWLASQNLFQFL